MHPYIAEPVPEHALLHAPLHVIQAHHGTSRDLPGPPHRGPGPPTRDAKTLYFVVFCAISAEDGECYPGPPGTSRDQKHTFWAYLFLNIASLKEPYVVRLMDVNFQFRFVGLADCLCRALVNHDEVIHAVKRLAHVAQQTSALRT